MKANRFQNPEIAAIFADYPAGIRKKLLELRQLIFETAKNTEGVGAIEETIRWGQPSYITAESGSGTTIRLDKVKNKPGQLAVYVHCQTSLIDDFRRKHGKTLNFETNRAITSPRARLCRYEAARVHRVRAHLSFAEIAPRAFDNLEPWAYALQILRKEVAAT
ncbi:MAG: DUF1801 domain-containing protein [Anaerolineales bacterium]|nr:DUF1801 domain-containing protein [Anaerolineales bacterium]